LASALCTFNTFDTFNTFKNVDNVDNVDNAKCKRDKKLKNEIVFYYFKNVDMLNKSVLNVEVSCFRNYWEEKNPRNVNLLSWLTSTKYKEKVDAIRAIDDKAKRGEIKATLPAITPSGLFRTRETKVPLEEKLIKHSGLIQIDVDNLDEGDLEHIKKDLQTLDEIAYLGKSVSGRGLWGLIPIPPDPEYHGDHFEVLLQTFKEMLGITLDNKPKNVASLRGYSYDPEAYFNHSATPFINKSKPIPKPTPKPVKTERSEATSSKGLEDWIIREMENLTAGNRHAGRLKLGRQAGGFVAGGSMDSLILERLIQSYLGQYGNVDSSHTQGKEIKAIQDGFENGKLFPLYPEQEPEAETKKTVYPVQVRIEKLKPEDYISQLHFENRILMNDMNYPADWDLVGSYTDQKTKDFIQMAIKNPLLIELRKQFDLS